MVRRVALCALVSVCLLSAGSVIAGDDRAAVVERGAYLVRFGGCGDCHTPLKAGAEGPEPDMARAFSGHPSHVVLPSPPAAAGPWNVSTANMTAWVGPWGISYAANLTSDPDFGLGAWTEEMFVKAMRTRQHLGMGRDILPPMPDYSFVADEDLAAIFAYFMTVPAIANEVPEPVPPAGPQPN